MYLIVLRSLIAPASMNPDMNYMFGVVSPECMNLIKISIQWYPNSDQKTQTGKYPI